MARFSDTLSMFHDESMVYGCSTYPLGKNPKEIEMDEAIGVDYCLRCIARHYWCYQRIRMAFYGWQINWQQPRWRMMK